MRHPDDGVLRRLLDEPAGVADADRRHAADCPRCLDVLAGARRDGAGDPRTRTTGPGRAPVDAAPWRRTVPGPARVRAALRRPAVAGAAVVALLAGAGTAGATDWLPVFRTERVAPIGLSAGELVALPDLSPYGEVVVTGGGVHEVPDAAAAAARTGLDVPTVGALPRGVTGAPVLHVGGAVTAELTFSAARAERVAADAGRPLPPPPPGLDGSRVRLLAGPGVAQVWSRPGGPPSLVVGRAVAPSAVSTGVPFGVARDYLLGLPGVPDDVAAQLRAFTADGATLPLPVPEDRVATSSARVDGVPATVLRVRDGSMAAVVWVRDGLVTVVAGSLDVDEVLAVAEGLR